LILDVSKRGEDALAIEEPTPVAGAVNLASFAQVPNEEVNVDQGVVRVIRVFGATD
jgi:hypothetical protein